MATNAKRGRSKSPDENSHSDSKPAADPHIDSLFRPSRPRPKRLKTIQPTPSPPIIPVPIIQDGETNPRDNASEDAHTNIDYVPPNPMRLGTEEPALPSDAAIQPQSFTDQPRSDQQLGLELEPEEDIVILDDGSDTSESGIGEVVELSELEPPPTSLMLRKGNPKYGLGDERRKTLSSAEQQNRKDMKSAHEKLKKQSKAARRGESVALYGTGIHHELAPIQEFQEMITDMVQRVYEVNELRKAIERMAPYQLNVATMCSGTEAPLLAFEALGDGQSIMPLVLYLSLKAGSSQGLRSCNFDQSSIQRGDRPLQAGIYPGKFRASHNIH